MLDKKVLIIFAKLPVPGKVKTRLLPYLTSEKAAELYKCLLIDTLISTKDIKGIDRFIICYPSRRESFFQELSKTHNIGLLEQTGMDLGRRMENAMNLLFSREYERVIIIGSDSPDLPAQYIEEAFFKLNNKEIVIGPSDDGGYYLIGASKKIPLIFDNIPWGTDRVMGMTIERIKTNGSTYSILPSWYDIDCIGDLYRLNVKININNRSDNKLKRIPHNTIDFINRHPDIFEHTL